MRVPVTDVEMLLVCRGCRAAVGARCTVRGLGGFGMKFVAAYCVERVEDAGKVRSGV